MESALFWIDWITIPLNVFKLGLTAGVICSLVSAGLAGILGASNKWVRVITLILFIGVTIFVWILGWLLIVWYNTPLGPPLEIVK